MKSGKEVHFGQLAIVLGYVSPASVAECLKLQKMLRQKDVKKQLGQILVEQEAISEEQFKNILKRQGVLHVGCPKCDTKHEIETSAGENLFKCPKCSGPLYALAQEPEAATRAPADDPLIGQTFAGARLASRLTEDDFTRSYKGVQVGEKREVLVKFLKEELAQDPQKVKRFMARAAKAAKVRHGSVASVYDVAEDGGHCVIVEELVEGTSLARLLQEEKNLPPRQAVRIALQVAQGLKAIHARGAVHGYLSPASVMLNRKGKSIIINLSSGPDIYSSEEVFKGAVSLDPRFAAPETVKDATRATPRSDIFSLGAMLYRMIVGAGPFIGESDFDIVLNNLQGKYIELRTAAPALPEALFKMISKMLKRNSMQRYETAAEIVTDFEKLDVDQLSSTKLPAPKDLVVSEDASPVQEAPDGGPHAEPDDVGSDIIPKLKQGEIQDDKPERPEVETHTEQEDLPALEPLELPAPEPSPEADAEKAVEPEPIHVEEIAAHEEDAVPVREPKSSRKQRGMTADLPEIAAFLESEPQKVELSRIEKQEILEESRRREEKQEVMPPPEVIEAMVKAGKKKGKPLPIVIAVAVIVVLVVIFVLVASFPGSKEGEEKSAAQQSYDEAIEFANRNPDKVEEQIERFREIMRKFPDTNLARNARIKVAQLEKQLEKSKTDARWMAILKQMDDNPTDIESHRNLLKEYIRENTSSPYIDEAKQRLTKIEVQENENKAAAYVADAEKQVGKLCDENKFREASELIEKGLPPDLPRGYHERRLQGLMDLVYKKAQKAFQNIAEEARVIARKGKVDEAVTSLNNIINNFGISEYADKARKIRAELLNAEFDRWELASAAFLSASQAANDLASAGRHKDAAAVLDTLMTQYALSEMEKRKVSERKNWVMAAERFLQRAYGQLSSKVGKFISLRDSRGILHEGTLKKFQDGMIIIGNQPEFSVSQLPRSEIVRIAQQDPQSSSHQSLFEEASYHYFNADIDAAKSVFAIVTSPVGDMAALAEEIARIRRDRSIARNLRIFNGRDLKGWKGDTKGWKVENNLLIGTKGQLVLSEPPAGEYEISFHVRLAAGSEGFDILVPFGGKTVTWHVGSEKEQYSEVVEDPKTRKDFVLFEEVWYSVRLLVSSQGADARVGGKTIWKLDSVPEGTAADPIFGFKVDNGSILLDRMFLKEMK